MAKVNQRFWKAPGRRARRKAWGYTVQVDGKQTRVYKVEWTKEDAEQALAAVQLQAEQLPPRVEPTAKPPSGMTLEQAAERYLAMMARKRGLGEDRRLLKHLKKAFGAETPLAALTASRISEYKATRLASGSERKRDAEKKPVPLSAASINRPLALLRHLLRLATEEWEVLPSVPKIRLEKEPEGRRWLEPVEEERLLAACKKSRNPHLANIVTVAFESGLRRSGPRLAPCGHPDSVRERRQGGRARRLPLPRLPASLRIVVRHAAGAVSKR